MLAWAHDDKTADLSEASQRLDLLVLTFLTPFPVGLWLGKRRGQAEDCLAGDEFSNPLYSFQSEKPFLLLLRKFLLSPPSLKFPAV